MSMLSFNKKKIKYTLSALCMITLFVGLPLSLSLMHQEKEVYSAVSQTKQESKAESSGQQSVAPSAELATKHRQPPETPYDIELIEANGLELGTMVDYESVAKIIDQLFIEYNIDTDQVSIAFYDYNTDELFEYNGDVPMVAASVYKMPLVAIYIDAINEGYFSYDTHVHSLTQYESDYQDDSSGYAEGSIAEMMAMSIIHSDNDTAWALVFNLFDSWGSFANAQLEFVDYPPMPEYFYTDNYMTASQTLATLIKISTQEDYEYLIELMLASEPRQLFTSYVSEGMANKYGRFDEAVNDAGTYFEDDEPIYSLAAFTDSVPNADIFLEELNLRINEWIRHQNI